MLLFDDQQANCADWIPKELPLEIALQIDCDILMKIFLKIIYDLRFHSLLLEQSEEIPIHFWNCSLICNYDGVMHFKSSGRHEITLLCTVILFTHTRHSIHNTTCILETSQAVWQDPLREALFVCWLVVSINIVFTISSFLPIPSRYLMTVFYCSDSKDCRCLNAIM